MSSTSNYRYKKTTLKTASGRTVSSSQWLQRHINDQYVALAKSSSYRSRAAFKLLEIDEKFSIFRNTLCVLDLGAAPGSWLQVARQKCNKNARIIGLDLQEITVLKDIICLQGDFTHEETISKILETVSSSSIDLIISDMSVNSCGDSSLDTIRNLQLLEAAYSFALQNLKAGGHFVAKILCSGGPEQQLIRSVRNAFASTKLFKPKASYKDSKEQYLVALNYIARSIN